MSLTNEESKWREDGEIYEELMHSGPAGIAAATAIASGKKRHSVVESSEGNSCVMRRQQCRLLRKLSALLDEYVVRVGQQAVVVCMDDKQSLRVFGSQPLDAVVKGVKGELEEELNSRGVEESKPSRGTSLPPLTLDGKPVSLSKMTQAHLRYFVPEMLKHANTKGKPGWGKQECRPVWWPDDIPWCNVRSDCRSPAQKKALPWTKALRKIVKCCYQHHGCSHLLHEALSLSDNSPLRDESPTSIKELAGKEVLIRDETSLDQSKAYYFVNDMPVVVGLNGIKHE